MTINDLPDEILLAIFGFCVVYSPPPPPYEEDTWHTLVHVCRRWRFVVFGSPRRLNLRLLCMNGRPLKTLDIWPELPIVIHVDDRETCLPLPSVTNVISMLKQNDRVCKIVIDNVPSPLFEQVAAMAKPFPVLIELTLTQMSHMEEPPTFPDSFLGGSAPRLQSLCLYGFPFPEIGRLLSSTRDLSTLTLGFIPNSGYVSPEAMVDILSTLTKLKSLYLSFEIPHFSTHGASRRPPGPVLTRAVLPALTTFDFASNSKYMGDIVSRIDAPLDCFAVVITPCDQDQLAFDIPLLRDFIWRTKLLNAPHRADIFFTHYSSRISLYQRKGGVDSKVLNLGIPCFASDSQLSALAQTCSSLLLPLPSLEYLNLYKVESELWSLQWQNEVESAQWMELLRPFITVKNLVLANPVVLSVASALQELVGEQVTEILPLLQTIVLEGFRSSSPVPEGIVKFIAARLLCGRPVVVHRERK